MKLRKLVKRLAIFLAVCVLISYWPALPHHAANATVYVAKGVTGALLNGLSTVVHAQR